MFKTKYSKICKVFIPKFEPVQWTENSESNKAQCSTIKCFFFSSGMQINNCNYLLINLKITG